MFVSRSLQESCKVTSEALALDEFPRRCRDNAPMPIPTTARRKGSILVLFIATAFAWLTCCSVQAADTTSGACVRQQVHPKSGLLEIVNGCDLPVSVYYRDLNKPPKASDKPGTTNKPRNAYYTHMKVVLSGKTEAIHIAPAQRVRVAFCMGQKRPYDSSGFRSDEAGNHFCPHSELPVDYLIVQATGASRDEACSAVRNAFLPGQGSALDCQCIVQASSGKAFCRTAGPARDAKDDTFREGAGVSVIGRGKQFLHEKNKEYWDEKYRKCGASCPDPAQVIPRNGGPGVRG